MRLLLLMAVCGIGLAVPAGADPLFAADGSAPIIFTVMTHTDGTYSTECAFAQEVTAIQWGLALYDEFGVKMNLEASKQFAAADVSWSRGTGFLRAVLDAGHGIGTHCNDVNAQIDAPAVVLRRIQQNKAAVDARVGATNNVSVSGICGRTDWVIAAATAQFKITDAAVGYCYLSMPSSAWPAGWTEDLILNEYFHDAVPFDFADRISPIRLRNAQDFVADVGGVLLVLSNGELGELASLNEGRSTCGTSCTLESADFVKVYEAIDAVKSLRLSTMTTTDVGRINLHVPTRTFTPAHYALLRQFLAGLKVYADAGTIVFGTQKDVLETHNHFHP